MNIPEAPLWHNGQVKRASCLCEEPDEIRNLSRTSLSSLDWPKLPVRFATIPHHHIPVKEHSSALWHVFGSSHHTPEPGFTAVTISSLPVPRNRIAISRPPRSSTSGEAESVLSDILTVPTDCRRTISEPSLRATDVFTRVTLDPALLESPASALPTHTRRYIHESDRLTNPCPDVVEDPLGVEVPEDMASLGTNDAADARRGVVSPRPKGRENAKNTLCRNIGIYGHCRWEKEGCAFNHDVSSAKKTQESGVDNSKRLNVESPAFQPLQPVSNGSRSAAISPKAADAAPFTPQTSSTTPHAAPLQPGLSQSSWNSSSQGFQEFVPQADYSEAYPLSANATSLTNAHASAPLNPYAQDTSALSTAAYFQNTSTFAQPAQYHYYAPMGPHRENLLAYQRTAHDFFMPDRLREELQKKAETTLQVLPSSTLPNVENFHSLVPLDTSGQRSNATFGYVSWLYKAQSSKDGKYYALRRLEGYRLTNEKAIQAARSWKPVYHGSIVNIHEAFTTREFGDSSLIVVTDYHPNAKTLAETHLQGSNRYSQGRQASPHVPENVLWSYVVQIASAIKAAHSSRLAVRTILPNKVIVTSKNRVRLNGCGILDVVQFDNQYPLHELQQEDFVQLGRLILSIAGSANAALNINKAIEHLSRTYTPKLKDCVMWLLSPPDGALGESGSKNIDSFLQGISTEMCQAFDMAFHESDTLTTTLSSELENGRLVRLLAKLGLINDRPEFEHNTAWSETGERYYLKLFRDYVFHAVDENGRPVTDLGHIISCLNKLDAGSEEKIMLTSRDEQSVFVVSYKEVKKGLEAAFGELIRGGNGNSGGRRA